MDKKNVVWTETAAKQRREILKYWTVRNGSTKYAEKLIFLTKERIALILNNPNSFRLTEYSDTRATSIEHFSLIFRVTEKSIIVMAFWDNRQNPKRLLRLFSK